MAQRDQRIRIDHWIVAILLFTMASIAFINVLSRYLFHFSFAATEEITINLFVWMTVIGSGIAFERGGQLGMITLYNLFPKKFKKFVIVFSSVLFSGYLQYPGQLRRADPVSCHLRRLRNSRMDLLRWGSCFFRVCFCRNLSRCVLESRCPER